MNALQNETLLQAWESGAQADDVNRPAAFLAVAHPEIDRRHWLGIGLPEVMLQLLRLRHLSFGPQLTGFLPCSSCGARLEFNLQAPELIAHLENTRGPGTSAWRHGNTQLVMRQINLLDLSAVRDIADADSARRKLLLRCVTADQPDLLPGATDESFAAAADAAFLKLHHGAELACRADCAGCGQSQEFDFDIARFLWAEVRHRALRLLREVHDLASAYGWGESEVLRLPPQRRRIYLEMAHS